MLRWCQWQRDADSRWRNACICCWHWNVPGQSGLVLDSMTAGNYSATLTDANGCTITTNATIAEPDSITLQVIATDARCYGSPDGSLDRARRRRYGLDHLCLVARNGRSRFALDVPAGTYVLLLTDANDCTRLDTFVITQPDSIALQPLVTPITCTGSVTVRWKYIQPVVRPAISSNGCPATRRIPS